MPNATTRSAALLAAGMLVGPALAQTKLAVYTAAEAEDLKKYAESFNEEYPDIKINWVRDSTAVVTAKLLPEKNNPQADAIWGFAGHLAPAADIRGDAGALPPAGADPSRRPGPA